MQFIKPNLITEAKLVASSIPETEFPTWSAATTYTVGAKVIHAHQVWERLVAGSSAGAPPADATNWVRVGPTNRWAMFDGVTGTYSSAASPITFTIAPGLVRGLALLDVTANSVTVTMEHEGDTVYERTVSLNTGYGVNDWYTYFFTEVVLKRTVVLTDLPPFGEAEITMTINGAGSVSVGTVVAGMLQDIGGTRVGMQFGLLDYSVKSTSEFGVTTLVERAYAKRLTVPFAVMTPNVDETVRRLTEVRATPVVWIGTTRFDQSVVYGFAKDWSIDLAYDQVAFGNITIEGLA